MSRICQTRVYPSLAAADDPPEAFQSWLDTLAQLGAEIQADAAAVLESVETTETNARSAQSAADDAEAARDAAIVTKNAVDQSVQSAIDAKDAAVQAQQRAQQAATNATTAMEAAGQAQELAEQALEEADAAVSTAQTSASSAADSATQAATSMTAANTAKLGAEAARDAAVVAKGAAETAQQRAETAEEGATAARTAAVTARTAAETAQTAAETAKASVDSSKAAIETMHDEMADYREGIEDYAELSRKWAEGKSFSGDAVPTDDETYHNNSKYWANIAATEASTVQGYGLYVDEEGNGRIRSTTDPGVDVSELARKADAIITSATGAIASFTDGADDLPVRDLTVQIEPVQDLHGYDSPWPAGGGKNLFDKNAVTANKLLERSDGSLSNNTSYAVSDYIPVREGQTITFTGFNYYYQRYYNSEKTLLDTLPTNTATATIPAGVSYLRVSVLQTNLDTAQIELGSTATSYAPYSNICPITGWTGAKVARTGKNLYEPTVTEYKNESGVSFNGFNITALVTCLNTLPIGTYNVSFKFDVLETVSGATSWGILLRNSVSGYIDGRQNGQHNIGETLSFARSITITAENKGQFVNAYLYSGGGSRAKVYWYDFQLELGSTATAYEPYTGNALSIYWESEAGTVYGGSLDVTTGVLTVDRARTELSESWYWYAGSTQPTGHTVCTTSNFPDHIGQNGKEFCSHYSISKSPYIINMPYGSFMLSTTGNIAYFNFKNESGGTAQEFKDYIVAQRTAGTPIQVEYTLATPQTYQLTPQEVKTMLGNNNIYSDTGDSSVTYPADTKLYIDGKIAAALGG